MSEWFYTLDASFGMLIVSVVCVLLACGGHLIVQRSFKKTQFIEHNEVAGFILAVVGVLYAVLLAFVTIVVWEHLQEAEHQAHEEVDAASDIWRLSRQLPAPRAGQIRVDLERYAQSVSVDEWPTMHRDGGSPETDRLLDALTSDIAGFGAHGEQQSNVQYRLLESVQSIADLRRDRIYDTGSAVPPALWIGLVVGAWTLACFIYLFGMENFRVQLLMTAATATMIGMTFGLILELDYPYRGTVGVTSEQWTTLSEAMAHER